ncbi:hypothetical protein J5N97_016239 [Dioscorea zingiberensis]|uniref:Uncharacterized protein n=1 Tax=Dioscorea zingiberensis TaxID=325984 RepID=A0A9D5CJY1_9LILI|nr:hypothetical protein J5N97_016239 [Dioscorea zingiberensis]
MLVVSLCSNGRWRLEKGSLSEMREALAKVLSSTKAPFHVYITNGSHSSDVIRGEALRLIHDGLDKKLLTISQDLLSFVSLDKKEVDFITLWVEETLIEDNLILDILFLCYYDSFCTCGSEQWKTLCLLFKELLSGSDNIGKLAASVEAKNSLSHAVAQLLLILIETLDLENLLRMGNIVFSLSEIQEIDGVVSSFSTLGLVEAGPLILAWATFLCLLLSLPKSKDYNLLPGPVSGFLSILRTFISAFIASYEVNHQIEDNNQFLVLDSLCLIYHGEESLSTQFWDRESFVDGPIRSLLYMLESEFPFRTVKLLKPLLPILLKWKLDPAFSNVAFSWLVRTRHLRLLGLATTAELTLSNGRYNFLSKISGVTSLFEIPHGSHVNVHDTVVTQHQLYVLGIEGLYIPIGSRGSVLRIVDSNLALVRWEYKCSGVILLLLRVAQSSFSVNNEETCLALNLFCRMMSFNMAVTSALLNIERLFPAQVDQIGGVVNKNTRIDMVEIICSLILNLAHDVSNAVLVSICIKILALMLKCAPSHVIEVASRMNIFGTENTGTSRSVVADLPALICLRLFRSFTIYPEDFPGCIAFLLHLMLRFLDFTLQLLETGAENDTVAALVVFSLQFILVNHVHWRYKYKYSCLELTLKVLELMKSCTKAMHVSVKFRHIVGDILLNDSSVHNIICCVLCNSAEDLEAIQVAAVRVLSMLCFVASKVQPYIFENVSFPANYLQIGYLRRTICHIIDGEMDGNEDLIIAIIVLLVYAARYQPAFLVSILLPDEDMEVTSSASGDKKEKLVVFAESISSKTALEPVLKYLKKSDTVFKCSHCLLLGVLKLLKALWEGGGQYMHIVEKIRSSEMFWGNLSSSISAKEVMFTFSSENLRSDEIQLAAYGDHCTGNVLSKKAFISRYAEKKTNETSKESSQARTTTEPSNIPNLKDILSIWCKSPTVENLIKSCSSIGNIKDIVFLAKMTVCLCAIHLMCKLLTSDGGCLSISLIEKIRAITKKLSEHPSFSALLVQYSFPRL